MELEYKARSTKASLKDDGTFSAVVSVFGNVDSYGEIVKYGAFTKSLDKLANKGRKVKILWGHNWERPVGVAEELIEAPAGDERLPDDVKEYGGLIATGRLALNTKEGLEAYEHLKAGTIDEFSIGYRVVADSFDDLGHRNLDEVELHEFSLVLVGANPSTSLLALKSGMTNPQKAEALATELDSFLTSMEHHVDMREKAGRVLSAANLAELQQLADALGKGRKKLIRLIAMATPQPKDDEPKTMTPAQVKAFITAKGIY